MTVGSLNCQGVSLFKLKTVLDTHTLDVFCIQETWLPKSNIKLDIPGYQVYEERREHDKRGGIAMLVRKGIQVRRYMGNEYA
jgi:exonuclease III